MKVVETSGFRDLPKKLTGASNSENISRNLFMRKKRPKLSTY